MTLIGMCGRSGSGKTYVSDMFAAFGVPSIDCDKVYRKMTSAPGDSPCMDEIKKTFGEKSVNDDGSLNRAYIGSVVFGDKSRVSLDRLNSITHRHILAEVYRIADRYASEGKKIVIVDAPTLFESGLDRKCFKTFCVVAGDETRISRICKRDGINEEAARSRLSSQISDSELIDRCDYVIPNFDRKDETVAAVKRVLNQIKTEIV